MLDSYQGIASEPDEKFDSYQGIGSQPDEKFDSYQGIASAMPQPPQNSGRLQALPVAGN